MGARLIALATLLASRYGAAAAQTLLRSARAWMADPANDATRSALVDQLRVWAERAGGAAGRLSARLAREVERRKVTVGAWERDLMALRYDIADMAPGPVREAALRAYAAQARAGGHLIASASRPAEARRQVLHALDAEAKMLRTERLLADERQAALEAIAEAARACAETVGAEVR
jgi:hypothetical protein